MKNAIIGIWMIRLKKISTVGNTIIHFNRAQVHDLETDYAWYGNLNVRNNYINLFVYVPP